MERCEEHGVTLPCGGCRADRLVAGDGPAPVYLDYAQRAAGEHVDRKERV